MNKLLKSISVLVLFAPIFTSGQIEVQEVKKPIEIGEVRLMGDYYGSMHHHESKGTYQFLFRNIKYEHIIENKYITISETDFIQLYQLIIKNIQSREKKEFELDIAGQDVMLKFEKGKVSFWLWDGANYSISIYFNEKQINTLFGK